MYRVITTNFVFSIVLLVFGCTDLSSGQEYSFLLKDEAEGRADCSKIKRVNIDLKKSVVEWKGTKLMGSASHTGTVSINKGYLLFCDSVLTGGEFVVDMTTIYNTDIPLSDPIPRKNITDHLNSDFETDTYPDATFSISTRKMNGQYMLVGDMTIKGITRTLSLKARQKDNLFITAFTIDRINWKIGENGSWLEKKLVDAEIALKVTISY